ncbi:MAG: response regulator transcription factor [Anaerolineae bacterium]|nr:response regulator transcription factor [Anaerolineae bacterium]
MPRSRTILIVEDERTLREVVRKYLELDGFAVLEAATGTEALSVLQAQSERGQEIDLILLDIMLPELDGFTVARKVRSDADIPIIVLSSRGEENDRLSGFDIGVDDYVVKPFSPREVVARVKAVLRRNAGLGGAEDDKPIILPQLRIDPRGHAVIAAGKSIALTAKEFDLLYFLARHPGQVFAREQLLDLVWGFEFYGDDSTVTVHIRRLREKIEPDPAAPTYIQTIWGVGYKFEASE